MDVNGREVVHAIPGRLRVKLAGLKQNPSLAQELRQQVAAVDGIRRVESSPLTGSLLLVYDAERLDSSEFRSRIAELFRPHLPDSDIQDVSWWTAPPLAPSGNDSPQPLADRVTGFFGRLNAGIEENVGPGTDLKVLVPISLWFLGMMHLLFGRRILGPHWYEYLWFSFATFVSLNPQMTVRPPDAETLPAERK